MELKRLKLVYFSPTGTSKIVLEAIAHGIGVEHVEHIDLTLPVNSPQQSQIGSDELTLIGAPVYGGRLPTHAVARIKQLKAKNAPAVLVVLYGNREFDDALLELKNVTVELGFTPIAGAVFIGEHSFASQDVPIANGRPDRRDIEKALSFGKKIVEKVTKFELFDAHEDLQISGNYPYKAEGARVLNASPETKEDVCTVCGTCATVNSLTY